MEVATRNRLTLSSKSHPAGRTGLGERGKQQASWRHRARRKGARSGFLEAAGLSAWISEEKAGSPQAEGAFRRNIVLSWE